MKWKKWLENWDMSSLRITAPFLEMEWSPSEPDKGAAWDLYIELLTRVATQPLAEDAGDEAAALASVYSLFPTTRAIIREHGRDCIEFTKLAIVVLNQVVRPFTTKWHRVSGEDGLSAPDVASAFREELRQLQQTLVTYSAMLADMAGVEDLTSLEPQPEESE
jgi:hypothetical protein